MLRIFADALLIAAGSYHLRGETAPKYPTKAVKS